MEPLPSITMPLGAFPRYLTGVEVFLQIEPDDLTRSSGQGSADGGDSVRVDGQADDDIGILHHDPGIGSIGAPGHGDRIGEEEPRFE